MRRMRTMSQSNIVSFSSGINGYLFDFPSVKLLLLNEDRLLFEMLLFWSSEPTSRTTSVGCGGTFSFDQAMCAKHVWKDWMQERKCNFWKLKCFWCAWPSAFFLLNASFCQSKYRKYWSQLKNICMTHVAVEGKVFFEDSKVEIPAGEEKRVGNWQG